MLIKEFKASLKHRFFLNVVVFGVGAGLLCLFWSDRVWWGICFFLCWFVLSVYIALTEPYSISFQADAKIRIRSLTKTWEFKGQDIASVSLQSFRKSGKHVALKVKGNTFLFSPAFEQQEEMLEQLKALSNSPNV